MTVNLDSNEERIVKQKLNDSGKKFDKKSLLVWIFVVFTFGYIVQRDVSLPSWAILGVASVGFMILFIKSMESPFPALCCLAAYIPFSKILVGDFGGRITALNFTNILMIFALMGMLAQAASQKKMLFGKNALNIPILIFCIISSISFVRGVLFFGNYEILKLPYFLF